LLFGHHGRQVLFGHHGRQVLFGHYDRQVLFGQYYSATMADKDEPGLVNGRWLHG
jgi:hypothetical protein